MGLSDSFQLKHIASNIGVLAVANMGVRIIAAANMILQARLLGPTEFGLLAGNLSLSRITAIFFAFGFNAWLLRNGVLFAEKLGIKTGVILVIKLLLGGVWIGIIVAVAPLVRPAVFQPSIIFLCALAVWFEDLGVTLATAFQSQLRNQTNAAIMMIQQTFFLAATLFIWWQGNLGVVPLLAGRAAAAGAALLIAALLFQRSYRLGFTRDDVRPTIEGSTPFAASTGLSTIAQQADVTITASFLGATAAGFYSPAISLISTFFMLTNSVHGVLVPMYSKFFVAEPQKIVSLTKTTSKYTLLGGLIPTAILFAAAPLIVALLYGPEFAESGLILRILSLLLLLRFMTAIYGAVLSAINHQQKRVVAQLIGVVVNIGLNLGVVFWTDFGIRGIATVYLISEAVLLAGYIYFSNRWFQTIVNPSERHDA